MRTFVNSLKWYSHQRLPFCKRHTYIDNNELWYEILQYFLLTFQELIWGFLFNLLFVKNPGLPICKNVHKPLPQSHIIVYSFIFLVYSVFKKKFEFNVLFWANNYKPSTFLNGNAFPDRGEITSVKCLFISLLEHWAKPTAFNTLSVQVVMKKWDLCRQKHFNMNFQNKEKLVYEHVLLYRCICKHHKKTTNLRNNIKNFH